MELRGEGMFPIPMEKGSPMKTSSSSNIEAEVVKAKKFRRSDVDVDADDQNEYNNDSGNEPDQKEGEESLQVSVETKFEDDFPSLKEQFAPRETIQFAPRETIKATRSYSGLKRGEDMKDPEKRRDARGWINAKTENLRETEKLRSPKTPIELETDPVTLSRRQKQIEYGKNTEEYTNYSNAVLKAERQPFHPKTPNKHRKYSRRAWDGLIRQWRLDLHHWSAKPLAEDSSTMSNCEGDSSNLEMEGVGEGEESAAETATTSSSPAVNECTSSPKVGGWFEEVEEEYFKHNIEQGEGE